MSPDEIELSVNRRITTAFIRTQPVSLSLVPRQRVKKPSGGYQYEDMQARSPQVMRFVEPPNPATPRRTADGTERRVEFLLLAEHDATIEQDDVFEHDGFQWEVVFLYHFNGWERRAEVARRG